MGNFNEIGQRVNLKTMVGKKSRTRPHRPTGAAAPYVRLAHREMVKGTVYYRYREWGDDAACVISYPHCFRVTL